MAVNGMTVGKDYVITYYDTLSATLIDFGDIQRFVATAQYHDIKSMPYNDDPSFGQIPDGYTGSFECVRKNANLEKLQSLQNNAFRAGQNIPPGYITETVHEADGSITRWQYGKAVFKITESVDVSREKTVPQKVEWKASFKIQIA